MEEYLKIIQKLAMALEEKESGALADFRRSIKDKEDQAAILTAALEYKDR